MTSKSSTTVPVTSTSASTSSPKRLYRVGNALIQIDKIMWTKRYRPLQAEIDSLAPETVANMGVGICSLDCQLAFEHALQPDKQVLILDELNKELESAGLLTDFYVLPDSTIIRPMIIDRVDYGSVKLGWVVNFYILGRDKPILTSLLTSESECLDLLQSLADRVNSLH